jgi:hypothetical protein
MLSGIQYVVPFPVFGAIRREGNKKGLESALAPVSESMSLVEYARVSLPFSLVEANTNNLGVKPSESGIEDPHQNVGR